MPQLDSAFYFSQLFWLFICFIILIFAFKKFFIPRMDYLLFKRSNYIEKTMLNASKLDLEVSNLNEAIKKLGEEEIKKASEIVSAARKKGNNLLNEQIALIKEEHNGLINSTKSRLTNEIRGLDSTFKIQVDIIAQSVFDKLFSEKV